LQEVVDAQRERGGRDESDPEEEHPQHRGDYQYDQEAEKDQEKWQHGGAPFSGFVAAPTGSEMAVHFHFSRQQLGVKRDNLSGLWRQAVPADAQRGARVRRPVHRMQQLGNNM
jgi:hypothetical protein